MFAAFAAPFLARARHGRTRRTRRPGLQQPGPIERDVGIVLLEQPHCLGVESFAAHPDRRRRAEVIKEALALAAATAGFDERGRFVTTTIAVDADVRQGYFLLAFFFAAGLAAFAFDGFALTALGLAVIFGFPFVFALPLVVTLAPVVALPFAFPAGRSARADEPDRRSWLFTRCTSVNRV